MNCGNEDYLLKQEKFSPVIDFTLVRLNKSLHGLKKAPLLWLSEFLKFGIQPLDSTSCIFERRDLQLLVYVDDILILKNI